MTRKTAQDFAPEVLKLFDQYVHGLLSRRGFVQGAAKYTAGIVAAEAVLAELSPNFAHAQQVSHTDERIRATYVEIPSPQGYETVRGYLVQPVGRPGRLPTVLVVHENRGLNPHIEDVARRLALEGFIAFAPDALYPLGGYPGDEDKARALFPQLDQTRTRADFLASAAYLKQLPRGNGKVGVVGFCYGGGMANFLATQLPDLAAAVPFYGAHPPDADVARIQAPLLVQLASNDERINADWPRYEAALKRHQRAYQAYVYPDTQHGFHNDTTPRYDQAAAALAWQRTVAFFQQHLRT
ncbi:MAG: carboxymethylenebutenolidase [Burkholderiales bacterium RIFCSPLOWO2_12_FULL_64_99]|nr:MAG: carboxymethylenebutenolidase [Burkholderiales bacterium RIFCSPHIGHO2_12_FULL_63_20]OGB61660.1 MAG: carboxymethylenebutenolidase [Burkholderiales bacterium RIFCSPLOWO2_12_FULL_64_99]